MRDDVAEYVRPGLLVWRGWPLLIGRVEKVGYAHVMNEELVAPVRYTNGDFGIIEVREMTIGRVQTWTHTRELRSKDKGMQESLRESTSMPDIISATPMFYSVSAYDGEVDVHVLIERKPRSFTAASATIAQN